ncbi:MAG: hypothetical protein CMH36_09675 [Microbacterium sp.]|jgi:hypothetical protein|uniref:General stress protein 17M-like domain-containing protein n=1 Tax=Microbacterium ginsengisoli TaxID=400772 RepID=A0A0F0LW03_9MICO|nr:MULTISPECIES: general stress protein [Microbacterium]MAL07079.1 hypothetical protein [Microbacterium sp.]MCK9920241.1 hypothetical protein [Microbacteriaceae bacterium K1510]KJL37288.1 hypothetical protein RR49_01011 [Microbacterium ginsengisoli]KQR90921.1 hypothetical protein ASF93_08325 [Microbacterium sp. Leaf347]KQS00070.1 hypothetical protein ASG00_11395 [Microbacterium sp. Leaf351]
MSMMSGPAPEGEVVASFPAYEGAQKAVSALIAADIPARDIMIVGHDVRSVERVTGRLGWAAAARSGAVNGLLLGMLFSFIFVFGTANVPIQTFVGVMIVGIAFGMLLSLLMFAVVRRRRDFASVMQMVAERYDVTVAPTSIHRAREVVGHRAPHPHPPVAERSPIDDEPPRYGERITPPASRPDDETPAS